MSEQSEAIKAAGWGKSPASRKWHYFPADDTFALCRKIGFYFGPREQGNDESADNCAECRRRLATCSMVAVNHIFRNRGIVQEGGRDPDIPKTQYFLLGISTTLSTG